MAKKLQYLIVHTTDTPYDRELTPDDIAAWHMGALKTTGVTYTFKGKSYTEEQLKNEYLTLPSGKKIPVLKTSGRGWTRCGYSDMIQRSGKIVNIHPYTFDDTITEWEMTNGATNYNQISRHVVLVGGWKKDGTKIFNRPFPLPEELYSPEQIESLKSYIKAQKQIVRDITIIGHNDVAAKTCPNFDVKLFVSTNSL
jgi:hypothetical protein